MRKKLPRRGDTRVKSGFLLFPKYIGDEMRWLEFAAWEQELVQTYDGAWGVGWNWENRRWTERLSKSHSEEE